MIIMASQHSIIILIILTFSVQIIIGCDNLATVNVVENIPYPSASLLNVASVLITAHIISNKDRDNIYFTDRKKSQPFALSNGKLIVSGPLDREKICGENQVDQSIIQKCCASLCCMYIGVTSTNEKIVYIRVNIEDENDNEPIFLPPFIKLQIHENVEVGHVIVLPKAEDLDSQNFGIDRYELIPDKSCSSCFQVKTESKEGRPILITKAKIDREINSMFNLQLLAIDRGRPSKTGSLSIVIDVEDINDNSPQFEESSMLLPVEENGRSGREIRRIRVTDSDVGVNSQLSYMIEDYSSQAHRYFKLVPVKNGVSLQLQTILDYDTKNRFQFYIVAKDHGNPNLLSTATVSVQVMNVNDEPPEILFYKRGSIIDPNSIQLNQPENGLKHQTIILIHVTDKDSRLSDLNCEVSHPKDVFYLREAENVNMIEKKKIFELQNLIEFDREITSSYRISITCSDSNSMNKLTTSVEIQLRIVDVNDNPPAFSSTFYFGKITETDLLDQDVVLADGIIQVTDADIGINSRIKFHLQDTKNSTDSKYFSVNSEYPQIKNKEPIDYEKTKRYEFLLVAVDGGSPPLSAVARITISVLDANDNRPEIPNHYYTFSVFEELPVGTQIGKIVATDADSDQQNRDVIFEMLNLDGSKQNQRQKELFVIENNTGFIKTRVVLDHEKDKHITFLVRVRNSNEFVGTRYRLDSHTSSVTISINIMDINDNTPKLVLKDSSKSENNGACLTSPKPIITINKDLQSLSNLCSVFPYTFTDADEGHNADVKVSLKENPHFIFEMGHNLICLKLQNLSPGYYTANVIGEDRQGGNGSKRAECLINIQVKTSSSNKPQVQNKGPRQEPQERMIDTKTVIIFIVLIVAIIIFCLLLLIVVFKSKLCLPGQTSPPSRRRGKTTDKQTNQNATKAYSTINPVGSCENKRLCDEFLASGLNSYRTVSPNYSNNLFVARTNSPNVDMRMPKYHSDNHFNTLTRSCDELFTDQENVIANNLPNSANSDMKYEQLHGTVVPVNQSNNSIVWDKSAAHQYNYLLEPRDSGSLPGKAKGFVAKSDVTTVSSNPHQKSINDVYLQTSFV